MRFIILDPNGEYSKAFKDMENVRLLRLRAMKKNIKQLQVPFVWNSAEWCAFTQASSKTQRPTLIQALRSVRDEKIGVNTTTPSHCMRKFLRTVVKIMSEEKTQETRGEPSLKINLSLRNCKNGKVHYQLILPLTSRKMILWRD